MKAAALGIPNGVTFFQLKNCPPRKAAPGTPPTVGQPGVVCHSPGATGAGVLNVSGADPSPTRRAIIAAAAASPVATPSVLDWLSGIAPSEVARAASRVAALFVEK